MKFYSWKLIASNGKKFEITNHNFFGIYHLGNSMGKYAQFESSGEKFTINRSNTLFPMKATISKENKIIASLRYNAWKNTITFENGSSYFTKMNPFRNRLLITDVKGKILLKKTNPKVNDKGIGVIEVDESISAENLKILLPASFYMPVLYQRVLLLIIMFYGIFFIFSTLYSRLLG